MSYQEHSPSPHALTCGILVYVAQNICIESLRQLGTPHTRAQTHSFLLVLSSGPMGKGGLSYPSHLSKF